MIYCKISDLKKYAAYSENLKKAIDYILSTDLINLPMGKTLIDGEKIYLNKSKIETKEAELLNYEVHQKYIDIQIDLEGDELIYIKENNCECIHEYESHDDYALYRYCKKDASLSLNKENCVVIFPNEIHMPCVKNTSVTVQKCVIKVLDN